MLTSTNQLGFPRRVVALYLLFCLSAVLLLSTGAVMAVDSLLKAQAAGDALSQVGRLAAAIEIDLVTTGGEKTQALVENARKEGRLTWCAVVAPDGRYLAHSDPTLLGAIEIEPIGSQLRWGAIDGVRYSDENGLIVNAYRAPLSTNNEPVGSLVMAVAVPGWKGVVKNLAEHAPLAIVGPLGVILLGGWWLRRTTRPLADIERGLSAIARQPYDDSPRCEAIAPSSLAAIGWNRIAQAMPSNLVDQSDEATQAKLRVLAGNAGGKQRAAIESLSEGIAITDAEGRIDFANRAVAALLGSDDEIEGVSIDELLAGLASTKENPLAGSSRDAEVVSELQVATGSGDRMLRLARAPLGGDASTGHVWSLRDITQQKLTDASRDQFIDTATHELRTPLANIKAYAETLAMGDMIDIEEQKEFCNTINAEATRLARFVDDLLSISSLEVGSLGIQRTTVDVRRLLDEAADKIRPTIKQRGMTFEVKLSEKLGEARLDKDKVSGMVVNLLGNAAKYTPEGGTVTLTAVREDEQLKIEVRDTGVGIAADEAEKVFEKFFRSANPAVQDQVGTGLGLPLAREIARLHRGELTLASKLGEGCTFTALLPLQ
ncbi:Alginate biosynthesis sensor protein KinB [Botrimarina colliarenosi]|uniref:histidine kinase n=1 Tax=Botrimarina colliarenosi TaxID=2528001 RepID=A0A5C6AIL4_9BACT|nr:ATP-binding protein [Botrimarina colliarenosi]TWT98083.1 Alginate biosynthesis sensor protein KinB [Botrimarina colliarenosi]